MTSPAVAPDDATPQDVLDGRIDVFIPPLTPRGPLARAAADAHRNAATAADEAAHCRRRADECDQRATTELGARDQLLAAIRQLDAQEPPQ